MPGPEGFSLDDCLTPFLVILIQNLVILIQNSRSRVHV